MVLTGGVELDDDSVPTWLVDRHLEGQAAWRWLVPIPDFLGMQMVRARLSTCTTPTCDQLSR